jgi:hypothetical protein
MEEGRMTEDTAKALIEAMVKLASAVQALQTALQAGSSVYHYHTNMPQMTVTPNAYSAQMPNGCAR